MVFFSLKDESIDGEEKRKKKRRAVKTEVKLMYPHALFPCIAVEAG
jgi:hypothetical protein